MKKHMSVIAIALVICMLFSLAACSGGNKNVTTKDNATGSNTTATGDNSTPADDGKFVGPACNGDNNLRLQKLDFPNGKSVSILTSMDFPKPTADEKKNKVYPFFDVYGLDYTCNVVSPEESVNKFTSMAMSGDAPDIYWDSFRPSIVNKGLCLAWDDYIDFNTGLWKDLKTSLDNIKWNGKYYCISAISARWDFVWYNTELFEEAGLKTPKEYYQEGNWTWDTYRELAKELTIDADGNGEPEQYGCAIDQQNMFVFTTGHDIVTLKDGKATNDVKSAEVARAVQFYADLFVKDKCAYQGSDAKDEFTKNKIAMITGGLWYKSIFIDMMKAGKVFFVPYPKDPKADKYYLQEEFGNFYIGKDAKNPQGAAAYMESQRYGVLDKSGRDAALEKSAKEEGWTKEMDDWLYTEFYKDDKVGVLSTYIVFDVTKYWGDIWFRPLMGEAWATVAEEISPKIDDDIARVLEG